MEKAQSAIEFTIIVASVMVFMILFIGAVELNRGEKIIEQRNALFNEMTLSIKDEINLAAGSTDGYAREFRIPDNILGLKFNVTVSGGDWLYISSENGKHAMAYAVQNVTGDFKIGSNVIERINGTVYLNRV